MPFEPFRTDLEGDVVIINEPPGAYGVTFAKRGAGTRGKERFSMEVSSEAVLFDLSEMRLGAEPSEAIRAELEHDNKNIDEVAAPATLARRKAAADNPNSKAAQERYAGGRIGFKAPNQSVRLFNDSNRLSEGFFVRENPQDSSHTINLPSNRFSPAYWGAKLGWVTDRWRSLMPILKDQRELLRRPKFNAAVSSAVRGVVQKAEMAKDARAIQQAKRLLDARRKAVRAFVNLGRTALGL